MNSFNIVLFGETGVGRSSVINLIAGWTIAQTSPDVRSCPLSFKPYTFPVNGRTLQIWDTAGFNKPETGIDLLLFCIRGNPITVTTQRIYTLFYEVLCRSEVPIALVITHLERETNMEGWWLRNEGSLEKHGIKAVDHACVTGLPTHSKYPESRRNIAKLLERPVTDKGFTMPSEGWLIEFLRLFGLFAPLKRDSKRKDILKVLTKRCGLDPKMAEELATKLSCGV